MSCKQCKKSSNNMKTCSICKTICCKDCIESLCDDCDWLFCCKCSGGKYKCGCYGECTKCGANVTYWEDGSICTICNTWLCSACSEQVTENIKETCEECYQKYFG